MPQTRKKLISKLINEGFTHRTLSLFSDDQLKQLNKKLFKEEVTDKEIKDKEKELAGLYLAKAAELEEDETEEELDIETDETGNPDVEIDGTPLLREKEIEEKFASKAQQKYLYAVNPAAAEKLASKMTKKDYEDLPEKVNEEEMLEQWVTSLVEKNNRPEISKKNFIKTIKENLTKPIIGTEAQNDSFKTVVEIGEEMEPVMMVNIDGFDDDGHLNGYLKSDQSDDVIELNICPSGNIKLNGMNVGETELVETDRDDEGEYIGAPEATTAPVKTPTIAPTKPGEKKRRGPFQKPKVKPKPKAGKGDESPLPDWLTSTNLGKALTQHG
tara:strand:- start:116 stop:1099 length:984 start_codon:yes stop_codon:yes gene_type:complete